MQTTDELVVVRCQLGEREAFRELVDRWHGPLWSFLWRMVGDAGRSDDLSQEVWVRVVRGLPRLEKPDRFPGWLFTLARRAMIDDLRHAYRQPDEAPDVVLAGTEPVADRDAVADLLQRLEVDQALRALPPPEREAVVLFHLEDLPLADVAEILDVPTGTVKSRLHRARHKLADELRTREAPR